MAVVILTFIGLYARGQVTISGFVSDDSLHKPLAYVLVRDSKRVAGDITDANGAFRIELEKVPVTLEFSLLGYETKTLRITGSDQIVRVELHASATMLNPVDITAGTFERVAGNERNSIWDYAWLAGNLLLCEYGNRLSRTNMLLITPEGDTISKCRAPTRPTAMFNDCLGNAYLQGKDSVWQFYTSNGKLRYLDPQPVEVLDKAMRFCSGENEMSIYFAIPKGCEKLISENLKAFNITTHNDKMEYYIFDRKTETMRMVRSVYDDAAIRLKAEEATYGYGPDGKPFPETDRSAAASKAFFYTQVLKEIYAPMFYVRDSLYLLDHLNSSLFVLNAYGNETRKTPIAYHHDKDFDRMCLLDEERQNVYVCFEENGMMRLRLLDLRSGRVLNDYPIPYPFPYHITIHNGYIYYLHRDEKVHEARVLSRLNIRLSHR